MILPNINRKNTSIVEGLEQKEEKSDDSFENLQNSITTSQNINNLKESIEQKKMNIEYTIKPGAPIYSDVIGTKVLCTCPKEIFLRNEAIDSDNSNQDFLCITYGGRKVWIKTESLTSCKGKSLDELYPPTSEKVIKVNKEKRTMTVYDQYGKHQVKEFPIALSPGEHGDKTIRGDNCTPEGKYQLCTKQLSNYGINPKNGETLQNFSINYPNSQDAFEGLISGTISQKEFQSINTAISNKKLPPQNTKLGNQIMLHGGGDLFDWTAGCIAVDDRNMMWLLSYLGPGTDIYIE